MNKFYVITNLQKDPRLQVAGRIRTWLEARGASCVIQQEEAEPVFADYKYTDPRQVPEGTQCVLVLGGDGTVLRAARDLIDRHLPLFGINLGTLGYLAEVEADHFEEALNHLLLDEYLTEERMMLRGTAFHLQKKLLSDVALNDIVITRNGRVRVMDYHIYVNDRFLNAYSADGIILSTPTGSTGYSLSAGGPIVSPEASMIMITPVAPHTLTARSVVLPDTARIRVVIKRRNDTNDAAEAIFDGDTTVKLDVHDEIRVEKAQSTVTFVKLNQVSFLETLRKKMSTS